MVCPDTCTPGQVPSVLRAHTEGSPQMQSTLRSRSIPALAAIFILTVVLFGQVVPSAPASASTDTSVSSSPALSASPGRAGTAVSAGTAPTAVYRFWSPVYQGHFYTANVDERNSIIARMPSIWTYEGVAYGAFTAPVAGTIPLFRFWSPVYQGHFYTASAEERDSVIARMPNLWTYEGIAYYVYPSSTSQPDTTTVFRFWGPTVKHHFYTASADERDHVLTTLSRMWSYEGDSFRVPTAATPPAVVTPPTTTPPAQVGSFPSASNTGVPAGTSLSTYTGPCTITAPGTVIDAKTVNCALTIRAKDVSITRSVINGTVYGDTDGRSSFIISDSQVNIGNQEGTGISDGYFTATRVHVTGGNRSINCFVNCTVERSFVHGQFTDYTGKTHESGIRMGSGSVIRGNTITCDAPDVPPDAGCSAGLTGYGDFGVVQKNVIDGNLFLASTGGFCAYGGSTKGKPYSAGVNGIVFTNNVFQRGTGGKCGKFGPITSFDSTAPGNVWSNNTWDDGTTVRAAN
jgi:hypothetical protein